MNWKMCEREFAEQWMDPRIDGAEWRPLVSLGPDHDEYLYRWKPRVAPDTSLAASIGRLHVWNETDSVEPRDEYGSHYSASKLFSADIDRIIEATRQVDDLKKQLAEIRQLVGPWDGHGDVDPDDETSAAERVRQRIAYVSAKCNEARQSLVESVRTFVEPLPDAYTGDGDEGEGMRCSKCGCHPTDSNWVAGFKEETATCERCLQLNRKANQ